MKLYLLIVSILICTYGCNKSVKKDTDKHSTNTAIENNLLKLNNEHINGLLTGKNNIKSYGEIKKGDTIKHTFILVNQGTDTVKVHSYLPSCDCTAVNIENFTIKPSDSIKIDMTVATNEKIIGQHSVTTTLKTTGQRKMHLLRLTFELIE